MKFFCPIILVIFALSSCDRKCNHDFSHSCEVNDLEVVIIDSCQYLQYRSAYGAYEITHKGNCVNCKNK